MNNTIISRKAKIIMLILGGVLCLSTICFLVNGFRGNDLVSFITSVFYGCFGIFFLLAGIKKSSTGALLKPIKVINVLFIVFVSIEIILGIVSWIFIISQFGLYIFSNTVTVLSITISVVFDSGCIFLGVYLLREISNLKNNIALEETHIISNEPLSEFSSDFSYLSEQKTSSNENQPFSTDFSYIQKTD